MDLSLFSTITLIVNNVDITYLSTGYNNCDDGIISRICSCFGTKKYLLSYAICNKNIEWTHLWVQNITEL